jgi:putative FmdB family regulatory protein
MITIEPAKRLFELVHCAISMQAEAGGIVSWSCRERRIGTAAGSNGSKNHKPVGGGGLPCILLDAPNSKWLLEPSPCASSFILIRFVQVMPIYDYECRGCGNQFELLVLKGTVAACPSCQGQELKQLISAFAVSSETISQANVKAARRKYINSNDVKEKRVEEARHIAEHDREH